MENQNAYSISTPSARRSNRRQPIREGDKFKAMNGEVWTVIERGLFGNSHDCFSKASTRFAHFQSAALERMERV